MKRYGLMLTMLLLSTQGLTQTKPVHSFYSGFALLRDCGAYVAARNKQATEAQIDAATVCAGYVMGIADAHDMFSATSMSPSWCAPSNVTVGQMVNPIHRFLVANPQRMHLSASDIIVYALKETYPCP